MFQEQHSAATARSRRQFASFLNMMLLLSRAGQTEKISAANVELQLALWRESYTDDYNAIELTNQAINSACDLVHIPEPLDLSGLYQDLPLYTTVLSMIERAMGKPVPDQVSNCEERMFTTMPEVCPDIDTITPSNVLRWSCTKQCASQLPDAVKYCRTSTTERFLVPVANVFLADLNVKIEEWEVYAKLGAVDVSEPGMAENANLKSQDVYAWFSRWQDDYFEALAETSTMIVDVNAACARTTAYEEHLRQAAAAGVTELPSVVEASTNIKGPPVSLDSVLSELESKYGVGQVFVTSFVQTVEFQLDGLPTGVRVDRPQPEHSLNTDAGKARRLMIEFATASVVGVSVENVTVLAVGPWDDGARYFMDYSLSISAENVNLSPALSRANFTAEFAESMRQFNSLVTAASSGRRRLGGSDSATIAFSAAILSSLPVDILATLVSEGSSMASAISDGGDIAISNPAYETTLRIAVSIPAGISDVSNLLDDSDIMQTLAAAGVDLAAAIVSSDIAVVFERTSTAPPTPTPTPPPSGDVVDNTISLGELGAISAKAKPPKIDTAQLDVQFELALTVTAGSVAFIGIILSAWVVIRRRRNRWQTQLSQVVPTTPAGQVHRKALNVVLTKRNLSRVLSDRKKIDSSDALRITDQVRLSSTDAAIILLPGTPEPPDIERREGTMEAVELPIPPMGPPVRPRVNRNRFA
jgi:hypothetical protein